MYLRILYVDRIGVVRDIAAILAKRNTNIVSMEVEKNKIYLECESVSVQQCRGCIEELYQIVGIEKIDEISTMPSKERGEQLDAILTSVHDGILSVNRDGIITQYNPAAARVLNLPMKKILGQPLGANLFKSLLIEETLRTGSPYHNREIYIDCSSSYCVVSMIPLRNNDNEVVGVVALFRDNQEVRSLMNNMTASLPMTFADIPYASAIMGQVLKQARRYAASDSTILIRGETGTGKELFARALHSSSTRASAAFIAINCAAIPETLLESELFGYARGAFTGAAKGGKPGMFELANGGTLFLDEVGEISAHLQVKLLRVLQEKRVRRVGCTKEVAFDVRIIAATNRNLEDMVADKTFREDLYYRLNVIPLLIPPLRERFEDIRFLGELFLQHFAEKLHIPIQGFSSMALQRLQDYNWPGNVRELRNSIERAVNLVDGTEVQPEHIFIGRLSGSQTAAPTIQFETYQTLEERLAEIEVVILKETFRRFRSSRRMGAVLGLSHTAVLKKLHKYNFLLE